MNKMEYFEKIRYRGDSDDIRTLNDQYNIAGFLDAREKNEKESGAALRERFLSNGVLLNETISPRIFKILKKVQEKLNYTGEFELFCLRDDEINAFAYVGKDEEDTIRLVAITSAALEKLNDEEISFIIGHELGHIILGHTEVLGVINNDNNNPNATVLPYLGECLFLRWQKKGELSADRIGIIASGSFEASARALVKCGYGLSEKNLNLDLKSLMAQIEIIKNKPEALESVFQSHPLLPLRLKALHLFSLEMSGDIEEKLAAMDKSIDKLFSYFNRYPRKKLYEAVMRIIAISGMNIVCTDENIEDEEIRTVIYILHSNFTDNPEDEIIVSKEKREVRLQKSLDIVNKEGDVSEKQFILCRLADIALADGKLMETEASIILEIAESLGMNSRFAYSIIIGAAQSVGFKKDYRMQQIIHEVKTQLVQPIRNEAIGNDMMF